MAITALFKLDDEALTNVNRTVEQGTREVVEDIELADGTLCRDVVAVKKAWRFEFRGIPSSTSNMPDGGLGKDGMEDYNDGAAHTLKILRMGTSNTYDSYTVVMRGFSARLVNRWDDSDWHWDVGFELMEV